MCCLFDVDLFSPSGFLILLIVGLALALGGLMSTESGRRRLRGRLCGACGLRSPHNAQFCAYCGKPLPPPDRG